MAKTFRRRSEDDDRDDDDFLQDGQIGRVPLMLRDSQLPDGCGGRVGHKPGFAFTRDFASRGSVAAAYESYEASLVDAWRGPISEMADEQTDLAVSDAAAHNDRTEPRPMDEVYRLYDEALHDAWKTSR